MSKQEIFEAMEGHFNTLTENHVGTTKASQQRARSAAMSIKKLVTDYKKASVEESK
jgi:hypothetical protein